MSKFVIFYLLVGLGGIGAYGYLSSTGWEYTQQETRFMPKEIMSSPGGYRSHQYWLVGYGGFRGGK